MLDGALAMFTSILLAFSLAFVASLLAIFTDQGGERRPRRGHGKGRRGREDGAKEPPAGAASEPLEQPQRHIQVWHDGSLELAATVHNFVTALKGSVDFCNVRVARLDESSTLGLFDGDLQGRWVVLFIPSTVALIQKFTDIWSSHGARGSIVALYRTFDHLQEWGEQLQLVAPSMRDTLAFPIAEVESEGGILRVCHRISVHFGIPFEPLIELQHINEHALGKDDN